ncbi:MAG: HEPN domain-containing protein [Clostridia bacterium]|nr:HEPN domain-containing protein [Clostridia bacterium]
MSKLLARAKVKRDNAEYNYNRIGMDDAYIDTCCNDLQQTIEFVLKYCVEMTGQHYVENHDVRAQMNLLKEAGVQLPCFDELRRFAPMLLEWETSTRYNDDFIALIEDINDIREIADSLISFADGLVKKIDRGEKK